MLRGMLAAAALLALAACGGSPCSHIASASAGLQSKASGCSGVTLTTQSSATCEANISKCSAADQDAIDRAATCMDGVGQCVAGQELTWAGQLAQCAPQVSAACQAALGQ
jgi:hypothetical protein